MESYHPYWIIRQHLSRANEFICSECKRSFGKPWSYCPNCGVTPLTINSNPYFPTEESRFSWKKFQH